MTGVTLNVEVQMNLFAQPFYFISYLYTLCRQKEAERGEIFKNDWITDVNGLIWHSKKRPLIVDELMCEIKPWGNYLYNSS